MTATTKRTVEDVAQDLLARLDDVVVEKPGIEWNSLCPAHDDKRRSLSVGIGDNDRIVVCCHAGCTSAKVMLAVGMKLSDLFAGGDADSHSRKKSKRRHKEKNDDEIYASLDAALASYSKKLGCSVTPYQYEFADGSPAGAAPRWATPEGKQVRQLRVVPGGWIKEAMPSPRPLYRLTKVIPAERVGVVEGEKAADALHGVDCGLVATTMAGGSNAVKKTDWRPLAGKAVYLFPDADEPGRKCMREIAGIISTLSPPATVRIVELPGAKEHDDIVDWLDRGGTVQDLQKLIDEAPTAIGDPAREMVEVSPDEHIVVAKALVGLAKDPALFHRAGRLVHVIKTKSDDEEDGIIRAAGTPRIQPVAAPHLRERISAQCYFFKRIGEGESERDVQVSPPRVVVDAIYSRGFWGPLRSLSGIIETPILRKDGSILDSPGWDEATGLIYDPSGEIPVIPSSPGRDEAIRARDMLLDLVCDFPFATAAHRAAWMAGVLTPFARRAFSGPAPMFVIDANVRGSGKSMLTDIPALLLTGREMPRLSNPSDDDEARKRITALMVAGDPLVLIDNIVGLLGSGALDAALTSTIWKDRRLGGSEIIEVPARIVWFATGNNVQMSCDTSRRSCHIRLESPLENPEERTGFKYPDLIARVKRDRLQLLTACLTILRAFVLAGRPDARLKPWGSFEGWSGLIRNAIAWIGLPDPGETRQELAEASDRDACALRSLFAGWNDIDPAGRGMTSADILTRLDNAPAAYDGVRSAVMELCGAAGSKLPSVRQLGSPLRRFRGRVLDGHCLEMTTGRARSNFWKVVAVNVGECVSRSFNGGNDTAPVAVVNVVNIGESFSAPYAGEILEGNREGDAYSAQGLCGAGPENIHHDSPHSPRLCVGCGFASNTNGEFCTLCANGGEL